MHISNHVFYSQSGRIAKELEFVKHNVRSKLDELKRIEMDRLRKLLQEQMERTELGLYRDEDGHLLNSPDGRRWRTIPNHRSGLEGGVGDGHFWLGWRSFLFISPSPCFLHVHSIGSSNNGFVRWQAYFGLLILMLIDFFFKVVQALGFAFKSNYADQFLVLILLTLIIHF